jgi:hydrogenase maturation protein HypF
MAGFPLCPDCVREYADPTDRRFHAQPVACAKCGPAVKLVIGSWRLEAGISDYQLPITNYETQRAEILKTRRLLSQGAIVAVKGLGGFHLACDASNPAAVAELRRRKGREGKPFAVMAATLAIAEELAALIDAERTLLTGRQKPIVLVARRRGDLVVEAVAPGLPTLGLMLPYTPLHHLLLNQTDPVLEAEPAPRALVMTSGNLSEEPLAIDNEEALARLGSLADAFLLHNRDIALRCDDSVVRVASTPITNSQLPVYLRRARGYAPYPLQLPFDAPPILATGGELKNTFCLTRERYAFMSQHIGDMENAETLDAFERNVAHMERLFRVQPQIIVHDLHPDYLSTRWASRNVGPGQQRLAVQHHHAHIAAVLADNGLDGTRPVIGLAYDGTGYGADGAIWGGEVLIADYRRYRRAAHLEYLPLPGGDAATRRPWRIAVGYAAALGLDVVGLPFLREADPREAEIVRAQVKHRLNTPTTSSMGRLFDAVAALAGVRGVVSYEAQAAIELEALAQGALDQPAYPYRLDEVDGAILVRVAELLEAVIHDVASSVAAGIIGARFHQTVAAFSMELCRRLREQSGLEAVALGGGVWQNLTLLGLVRDGLEANGFTVYTARQVPANDGGLALGQAAIAAHALM